MKSSDIHKQGYEFLIYQDNIISGYLDPKNPKSEKKLDVIKIVGKEPNRILIIEPMKYKGVDVLFIYL